jgi:hypothetical protein
MHASISRIGIAEIASESVDRLIKMDRPQGVGPAMPVRRKKPREPGPNKISSGRRPGVAVERMVLCQDGKTLSS